MSERKSNRQILDELDNCDNPVTRYSLKNICVRRLRDLMEREQELVEALGAILYHDERGQGIGYAEAMEAGRKVLAKAIYFQEL